MSTLVRAVVSLLNASDRGCRAPSYKRKNAKKNKYIYIYILIVFLHIYIYIF